ncbi:hypothetical protein, partial [Streptomyces sp. MMG1121]|uniref:CurL C-terminal domain-containing protein n=1 Tax=Streptomyces sp. MMG1121 TaxID=1415544 RepID=UPI001F3C989D
MVPWVLSARSEEALAGQARRLLSFVQGEGAGVPVVDFADVALSLVTSRAVFPHRAVVVGGGVDVLSSGLVALADGVPAS